ncbi:MAG: PqiC family protein [Pseudomonadota bacterium]
MMSRPFAPKSLLAGVMATMLFLAGCASSDNPTRYFMLSPVTPSMNDASRSDAVLGVGPVTLPSHLDRSQLVIRSSENRIILLENDRWAEPLAENVRRILGENLDARIKPARIEVFPWNSRDEVMWQIAVDIVSFEKRGDGQVYLEARWKVVDFIRGDIVLSDRFAASDMPSDIGSEATIGAMSNLLGTLADEIAAAFRRS